MGEDFGEGGPPLLPGEDRRLSATRVPSTAEVIKEKKLTFEEASKCLNTLGKDETGSRYAYLRLTATDLKLTDVSIILHFKHVLFLDLSGNFLTTDALEAITGMPFLILLKAERNRVESARLKTMHYLQVLDLNQNQIKNVEEIHQPLLETLELNYNDIYSTRFEESNLDSLKQLELRSNLLFEISGQYPKQLEKLYIAANKISGITPDFSNLEHLQTLHLRENNIQNLDGFTENLKSLKYLNLRNNKISKFIEFKKLQCLPSLEVLVVTGNPLPGTGTDLGQMGEGGFVGEGGKMRDAAVIPLLVLLPNLKRINKTVIKVEDRIEAEDMENNILDQMMEGFTDQETDRTTTTMPTSDNIEESED